MASLFQGFDLDEAQSTEPQHRRHEAGGYEAPRNSLDEGSSFAISCLSNSEDVLFGYKVPGRDEKQRRAPNVVAKLMGLDAMPEELPTRTSLQGMPRNGCERGKREEHPQEAELRRFKKEFAAKQQRDDMDRQLEEKKRKVRATLDKARLALSKGIISADPKHTPGKKFEESREFREAMEFLQCNKDFIFQFLQQKPHVVFSNNGLNEITTPVTTTRLKKEKIDSTERGSAFARLFGSTGSRKRHDPKKQQPSSVEAIATLNPTAVLRPGSRDLTSEDARRKIASCISSRYMLPASPKAQNKHADVERKELLRRQSGEGVQSSKAKHEKLRGFKAPEACSSPKISNFTLTKSLSTGKRISMTRPDEDDMSDGVGISTPKAMRTAGSTVSPATFRAKVTPPTTTTNSFASEPGVKTPTRRSADSATRRSNVKIDSPRKKLLHSVNDPASITRCRSVPNMALLRERGPCTGSPKPARSKPSDQRTLGCFSVVKGSKASHEAQEAMPASLRPSSLAKSCVSQRNAGCPNGKASTPRETKVRRNILDRVKSGRDSNHGLSSPVSVLQFPESPPGCREFKDISNNLQDALPIRLQRPQLDGRSKGPRGNQLDPTKGRVLNPLDQRNERLRDNEIGITRERYHTEVPHQFVHRPRSIHGSAERPLQTLNPRPAEGFESHLQILNPKPAEGFEKPLRILNPRSAEGFESHLQTPNPRPAEGFERLLQTLNPKPAEDFAFVCDALVASGLHTHGGRNIIRWHSATQPISPHLLERLGGGMHRRVLFDATNEVLLAKLELSAVTSDQCFGLPIVGAPNSALRGRRFVEDVWGEIQKRQYPVAAGGDENYYPHGLVAQDMETTTTTSSWLSLRRHVDRICLQVEKAIWNDLMEELCTGLLSVN